MNNVSFCVNFHICYFSIFYLTMNLLAGLMISGLARGGITVGNRQYIQYAIDAAKFIERYLFDRDRSERAVP